MYYTGITIIYCMAEQDYKPGVGETRQPEEKKEVVWRQGKGETISPWQSPELRREDFEAFWQRNLRQERIVANEDGLDTTFVAYELRIDARNEEQRNDYMTRFTLEALAAGYKPAIAPITVPGIARYANQEFCSVYYFFEKPPKNTSATPEGTKSSQESAGQ